MVYTATTDSAVQINYLKAYTTDTQTESIKDKLMDENKRKKIEAKLFQLFTQSDKDQNAGSHIKSTPPVVKVIRRRKGKPDRQVA